MSTQIDSETPTPLTEKDLKIPILLLLAQAQIQGIAALSTPQIRDAVTRSVVASPADLETTSSGEVRIERMARNLVSSHKVLEKEGLAKNENGLTSITPEGERKLVEFFVMAMQGETEEDGIDVPDSFEDLPSLSESELVAPALMEMVKAHINGSGPVSTAKLISGISDNVPMGKADKEVLSSGGLRGNRIIYNLRSHKKLTSNGFATSTPDGFEIAEKGWSHLLGSYLSLINDIKPAPDFSLPVSRKSKLS